MSNEYVRDDRLADGLSKALSEAREAAGLSGKQLAATTGLTPARISRIVGGKAAPRRDEVLKWAEATQLDDDAINVLLDLLADYETWRADLERRTSYGVAGSEIEYTGTFRPTRHVRTFALTEIPGYLQIREYAQSAIEAEAPDSPADERDEAVKARLERGGFLGADGRTFQIVIAESVLRWMVANSDVMRSQIGNLYKIFGIEGVDFRILPLSTRITAIPRHGFTIHDEQFVVAELADGSVTLRHGAPERYGRAMNRLYEDAVAGDAARDLLAAALAAVPAR